jgi:hypothetical protein
MKAPKETETHLQRDEERERERDGEAEGTDGYPYFAGGDMGTVTFA